MSDEKKARALSKEITLMLETLNKMDPKREIKTDFLMRGDVQRQDENKNNLYTLSCNVGGSKVSFPDGVNSTFIRNFFTMWTALPDYGAAVAKPQHKALKAEVTKAKGILAKADKALTAFESKAKINGWTLS